MTSASGYITREEIAAVAGLLCARPEGLTRSVSVDATTVNGMHENPLHLYRACVEVGEALGEAQRDAKRYGGTVADHMPDRPELFEVDYKDDDEDMERPVYSYAEEHDAAADRSVALGIVQALVEHFAITLGEIK